jgi:hypothetical protein
MINLSQFASQFSQTVIINNMLPIFLNTLGALIFLFIFWKRLKEDYVSSMIFTTAFYMLVGILLGRLVSFYFVPKWWFWTESLGLATGLSLGILRHKLRVFESIEAVVPGLLVWLSLFFLENAIDESSLSSLFSSLVVILFVVLFFFLDNRYKGFAWYKSGRIGFSGLTALGVFFLARAVVAATFPYVLSFVGTWDAIISSIIAFFAFLTVFNLARQKI